MQKEWGKGTFEKARCFNGFHVFLSRYGGFFLLTEGWLCAPALMGNESQLVEVL